MKCYQDNINFQTCILLIMDAWPVNICIIVLSAYVESKFVVHTQCEWYRQMLQTFRGVLNRGEILFQNGAAGHTARNTLRLLKNFTQVAQFVGLGVSTGRLDPQI